MKKEFILICFIIFNYAFSQNYTNQIIILNEGYFNYSTQEIIEPVSIGTYNLEKQIYQEEILINNARFASDMIINDDFLYVAADNRLIKYNINSFEIEENIEAQGIRNLAIHNNNLYVSRGDYNPNTFESVLFNSYLQVYDKNNLTLIAEIDTINGPKWSTQNIIIANDLVYVAINNGFEWGNEKGLIGVMDANTLEYLYEINLGEDGKNPDNMIIKDNYIITINNKDWSGSSISKINLNNNQVITENLSDLSTGCGTSNVRNDYLNYQISNESDLYKFDYENMETIGVEENLNLNFYEIAQDPISGYLYASNTDFFSYGNIYIYDENNNILDSFSAGISPGKIEFHLSINPEVSINTIEFKDNPIIEKFNLLGQKINLLTNHKVFISIHENGLVKKNIIY